MLILLTLQNNKQKTFSECFLSPEINWFFLISNNPKMRALGKKTHMFFGNARPKSNARAHLKQRKEHIGI